LSILYKFLLHLEFHFNIMVPFIMFDRLGIETCLLLRVSLHIFVKFSVWYIQSLSRN
jgi:hypothetical protein